MLHFASTAREYLTDIILRGEEKRIYLLENIMALPSLYVLELLELMRGFSFTLNTYCVVNSGLRIWRRWI